MKKMISWILVILLTLSLFACTDNSPNPDSSSSSGTNNNKEESSETNNGSNQAKSKISGQIEFGTDFSDGLALVRLVGDKNRTYCIDKEGYIVFEIDTENGSLGSGFRNGYATIDGKIYNREGKSIAPEDVGATEFDLAAAEGGYIIATKITSDFSATKKELGVLNEKFEWIVSPSEELYEAFGGDYSLKYSNHYLRSGNSYLSILTGEILEAEPEDFVSEPSGIVLQYHTDRTYRDQNNNIVIDLSEYDTLVKGFSFVNEKAIILFKNDNKFYFTLIDVDGVFVFDPVKIESFDYIEFDGEYVMFVTYDRSGGDDFFACYNSDGELEGKTRLSGFITIAEGIIRRYDVNIYGSDSTYYYNPDFTPLFD